MMELCSFSGTLVFRIPIGIGPSTLKDAQMIEAKVIICEAQGKACGPSRTIIKVEKHFGPAELGDEESPFYSISPLLSAWLKTLLFPSNYLWGRVGVKQDWIVLIKKKQ